jgi:hypothetical protein
MESSEANEAVSIVDELISRLARNSAMLNNHDKTEVTKLAYAISVFIDAKWNGVLEAANISEDPLLFTYMSDGWGSNMTVCRTVPVGNIFVKRFGRYRAEWLLEKLILKTIDSSGKISIAMKLKPPRSMIGKTGWHIFGAALDTDLLRFKVARNIIISVYLQDGLHSASITRWQQARHELFYDFAENLQEHEVLHQRSMDWVFGWRCILHIASSSIKWGLTPWSSESILEDTHISIASCRNGSNALHYYVDSFLTKHMHYSDHHNDFAERGLFWTALGVPASMLDTVLEVDPRWDFELKILRVNGALEADPQGLKKVVGIMLFCLQWRNWSETRWAGVGVAARRLILSLSVGLETLVKMVMQSGGSSNDKYHLGGFKRCSPKVKLYVAIASLALYPVEGFSISLLEDDRFLLRAPTLWEDILEELQYVSSMSMSVWNAIAVVVGDTDLNGWGLRSFTLQAMHVSLAYLDLNAYAQLREYPLSLTQGNVDLNVDALARAETEITDFTVSKIQYCCIVMPAKTRRSLRLLQDVACSTALVEKGHAAGAVVKRFHQSLGPASLRARALVSEARPLFRVSAAEQRSNKLRTEWQSLLSKAKCVRFSAANLLCSKLMSGSLGGGVRYDAVVSSGFRQICFKSHNEIFHRLPLPDRLLLEREAHDVKQFRVKSNLNEASRKHCELQLLEARQQAESIDGGVASKLLLMFGQYFWNVFNMFIKANINIKYSISKQVYLSLIYIRVRKPFLIKPCFVWVCLFALSSPFPQCRCFSICPLCFNQRIDERGMATFIHLFLGISGSFCFQWAEVK